MGKRKAKQHSVTSMEKNGNIVPSQLFASYPDGDDDVPVDSVEMEKSSATSLPCTPAKSPAPKKGKITSSDSDLDKVMAAISSLSLQDVR